MIYIVFLRCKDPRADLRMAEDYQSITTIDIKERVNLTSLKVVSSHLAIFRGKHSQENDIQRK